MKRIVTSLAACFGLTACGNEPTNAPAVMLEPSEIADPSAMDEPASDSVRLNALIQQGTVIVPTDEENEDVETLELTFARAGLDFENGEPILVHFGGPGTSASEILTNFVQNLPSEFLQRYTIIGLDDIGVGGSPQLNCDLQFMTSNEFDHPFVEASEEELEEFGQALANGCAADPLFDQLSTARYARDIDRLRAGLGYERMNILGFSYGTEVALYYAALFPDRVGRIVLDSSVDTRTTFIELTVRQARAYSSSFDRFLVWCDEQENCSIDVDRVNALIGNLANRSDDQSIEDADQLSSLLGFGLRLETRWPNFADVLGQVLDDPSLLTNIQIPGGGSVNSSAFIGTVCNDFPIDTVMEISDARAAFKNSYTGQLSIAVLSDRLDIAYICAFWGVDVNPIPPDARLPAPESSDSIMIISATGDTQTPRVYTEELLEVLPNAALVSVDEVSHAVSTSGLNPCLNDAVIEFFNEGAVSVSECPKSASTPPPMANAATVPAGDLLTQSDQFIPGDIGPFSWKSLLGR